MHWNDAFHGQAEFLDFPEQRGGVGAALAYLARIWDVKHIRLKKNFLFREPGDDYLRAVRVGKFVKLDSMRAVIEYALAFHRLDYGRARTARERVGAQSMSGGGGAFD